MKEYKVIRIQRLTPKKLSKEIEKKLDKIKDDGFEIISVSYGLWFLPIALITVKKVNE